MPGQPCPWTCGGRYVLSLGVLLAAPACCGSHIPVPLHLEWLSMALMLPAPAQVALAASDATTMGLDPGEALIRADEPAIPYMEGVRIMCAMSATCRSMRGAVTGPGAALTLNGAAQSSI